MTLTAREEDTFPFFQDYIFAKSAIVLTEEKRYLVETRLAPVVQQANLSCLGDLMRALLRGDRQLETAVVDAMTTNETSWFRDKSPFEALRDHVLAERMTANSGRRALSIWSAACSTGQEPYSVAMILEAHFPELSFWNVEILATDLAAGALARARQGRFSALEINRGLPAAHLLQYFRREGAHFQINDALKRRVLFQQLNLAQTWPVIPPQDVILLRNVLIYFDAPTRQRVLAGVRANLRPGGFLLLGAAETTRELVGGFVPISVAGTTVYQLKEN